jgi:hypothetical protein
LTPEIVSVPTPTIETNIQTNTETETEIPILSPPLKSNEKMENTTPQSEIEQLLKYETPQQIVKDIILPPKIRDQVFEENRNFFLARAIFSEELYEFVWEILNLYDRPQLLQNQTRKKALEFSLFFFTEIFCHAKVKPNFKRWAHFLRRLFTQTAESARWFVDTMLVKQHLFLRSFLVLCASDETRQSIGNICVGVVQTLAKEENKLYYETMDANIYYGNPNNKEKENSSINTNTNLNTSTPKSEKEEKLAKSYAVRFISTLYFTPLVCFCFDFICYFVWFCFILFRFV